MKISKYTLESNAITNPQYSISTATTPQGDKVLIKHLSDTATLSPEMIARWKNERELVDKINAPPI